MVNAMVEVVWQWKTTSSGENTIRNEQTKMLFMQKNATSCIWNTSVSKILHTIFIDLNLC